MANRHDEAEAKAEAEARAHLEKNKEKLRRLRDEFSRAEDAAGDPIPGATILGPKDELAYRRMKREIDDQDDDDE